VKLFNSKPVTPEAPRLFIEVLVPRGAYASRDFYDATVFRMFKPGGGELNIESDVSGTTAVMYAAGGWLRASIVVALPSLIEHEREDKNLP
jgi:hypothetical protein